VVVRQHLCWENGQDEYNARYVGGGRTAKYAKYANGNSVFIFAWFAWFAVKSDGVRQSSGALGGGAAVAYGCHAPAPAAGHYHSRVPGESGGGPPQSKTLARWR
jgi:hypothetical protein